MGRRDEVLDAAIDVLAAQGGRGLSHRAVDEAAGVPAGTTSNFFRTRRDLLLGTRDRLVRRLAETDRDTPPTPADGGELVRALGDLLRASLDAPRDVKAHLTLLYDAIHDEELYEGLRDDLDRKLELYAGWLAALGVPHEERHATVVLGFLRSLMLGEKVQPAADFDPEAALEPLVLGLLAERG